MTIRMWIRKTRDGFWCLRQVGCGRDLYMKLNTFKEAQDIINGVKHA